MTTPLHLPARRVGVPVPTVLVVAGVLVGIIAWQHQLTDGMATAGLGDVVPWGAYTVAYLVFVAVAAGAVGLGCAGVLAPASPLAPLAPSALLTAIAGLVAGILAYVVSLGRPSRVYEMLLHPNWSSASIWSLYAVVATLVIAAALLAVLPRSDTPSVSRAGPALAVVGLVAAVVMAGATAGIFSLQGGRAAWSGLAIPLFVVSAGLAGLAAVLLVARVGHLFSSSPQRQATDAWLRRLIVGALVAELALRAIGYLNAASSAPQQWVAMQLVLPGGGWSWLFWTQWAAGGLVPLAVFAVPAWRRRRGMVDAAVGLSIVGVVASYIALVPGALASPRVTLAPGMALGVPVPGSTSFRMLGSYHPTLTEYGVLIGLACVFFGVLALGRWRTTAVAQAT